MQDILLVGSIPLDTAEQVFRDFGKPLAGALKTMPDGEVGPRKHWISRIHYQVLAGHPELETVRYPAPENSEILQWVARLSMRRRVPGRTRRSFLGFTFLPKRNFELLRG